MERQSGNMDSSHIFSLSYDDREYEQDLSTMKSEIVVFMAMKKGLWVFQHIFMKKRFVVHAFFQHTPKYGGARLNYSLTLLKYRIKWLLVSVKEDNQSFGDLLFFNSV